MAAGAGALGSNIGAFTGAGVLACVAVGGAAFDSSLIVGCLAGAAFSGLALV